MGRRCFQALVPASRGLILSAIVCSALPAEAAAGSQIASFRAGCGRSPSPCWQVPPGVMC